MFDIGDIISSVSNLIGNWLKGKQAAQSAKQAMQLANLQNKARLLADTQSNNHEWEMANLIDKDKWLRRISFLMFASPFIIAILAPNHVAYYFQTAIGAVPEWWQKTFMAIMGGIWGISSLKNIIPNVIPIFKK